jgi:hypothetical protein
MKVQTGSTAVGKEYRAVPVKRGLPSGAPLDLTGSMKIKPRGTPHQKSSPTTAQAVVQDQLGVAPASMMQFLQLFMGQQSGGEPTKQEVLASHLIKALLDLEFRRLPKDGEVCRFCGLNRAHLYRLMAEGKLKYVSIREPGKARGVRLYRIGAVLSYLASLEQTGPSELGDDDDG